MTSPMLPLILSLTLLLSVVSAQADVFQYVDQDGTAVFVDDESKIPEKYRKKSRATKGEPGAAVRVTSVRVGNNRVFVPVRLNYRSTTIDAWFLLDTGASTTMITADLAARLGIRNEATEQTLSQVADGRVLRTARTRIDSLSVGPKLKNNLQVSIMEMNGSGVDFDGLLGMNFLGDFRYHLDVNSQVIEWQ